MSAKTIRSVAAFAESGTGAGINPVWTRVYFKDGLVYAMNPSGGACAAVDFDLSCGISAKALIKALRAVGDSDHMEVTQEKTRVKLVAGKTKISLPATTLAEAPALPRAEGTPREVVGLGDVQRVAWSVSEDTTRTHLAGISLGPHGAEATNGKSMARCGGIDYMSALGLKAPILVTPPIFKGLPNAGRAAVSGNRIFVFEGDSPHNYRFSMLLDAQFPPTDQIVGNYIERPAAEVDREALMSVVKRAKISTNMLTLDIKGKWLSVRAYESAIDPLFDFTDGVTVEGGKAGNTPEPIGIDGSYLLPLLEQCGGEKIEVAISGPLDPLLIRSGPYIGIIMPYRM